MLPIQVQGVQDDAEDDVSNSRNIRFRTVKRIQDEYTFNEETDVIGSGAFSVVYRATPTNAALAAHRRPSTASPPPSAYALKVIPRNKETDTEKRMQYREVDREVCVLQKLSHSGCSAFVDALQTADKYVIVMNLIDGCMDAGRFLKAFGPLTEEHAALVVYQLLATTQYLHRTFGLLHRDIKVENILLSPACPTATSLQPEDAVAAVGTVSCTSTGTTQQHLDDRGEHRDAPAGYCIEGDGGSSNKRPPLTLSPALEPPLPAGSEGQGCGCIAPSEDTAAMKDLRNYGKVTLVDFGLARWLPGSRQCAPLPRSSSSSGICNGSPGTVAPVPGAASSDCHTPPLCQSPVSPSGVPLFFGTPPPFPADVGGCTSTDATASSPILHIGCCGSDKYLAHEMLKWYVENCGGQRSGSGGAVRRAVTAEQAMKLDVYAIGVVAYVLLSGCLPYNGKTKALLAQQQATSALKMNSVHWCGVSMEAKQFVASLLATDQSQRLSVEAALAHNWMMTPQARCQKLHLTPEPVAAHPLHHHQGQGAAVTGVASHDPNAVTNNSSSAASTSTSTTTVPLLSTAATNSSVSSDASLSSATTKKEEDAVDASSVGIVQVPKVVLVAKDVASSLRCPPDAIANTVGAKSSEDVHDLQFHTPQQQQRSASKSSMGPTTAVTPKKQSE